VAEVPGETGIPHLQLFVRNTLKVESKSLSILLFGKGRQPSPYPSCFFSLYRVSGMSSVQGALILEVDISHGSPDFRV